MVAGLVHYDGGHGLQRVGNAKFTKREETPDEGEFRFINSYCTGSSVDATFNAG